MQELITIQNGQAVTTDILIAKAFNKRPSSVRRAIKNLNCSEEFRLHNFAHTYYVDQQGKKQPSYLITKDGFVLLVMGFTGKYATGFKIQYIEAFNKMEKYLQSTQQQYNQVNFYFNVKKDGISDCARSMVFWKQEKPVLLNILATLEKHLQLDLFQDAGTK
ncbi:Rha family transcriptional regulator [Acinetobacter wanghuae]|uniref:Rha family transcriptional regulator n=1 Tax=Acinetobacter wanghuae TaxID=2662362 RepID=A0A5Q0P135_9GAMM|nr:Rha family transcriptional regulator [Acinetobacter wanghuae]MQW92227.1 Rha family transcriptional regulator [Acinetobacter wanghuae]QGA10474.1 Rha family transcriptional regulator [Acinetobacter wanghuae]